MASWLECGGLYPDRRCEAGSERVGLARKLIYAFTIIVLNNVINDNRPSQFCRKLIRDVWNTQIIEF